MGDDYTYDLFWHALNYRKAGSKEAEAMWQELQACSERITHYELESALAKSASREAALVDVATALRCAAYSAYSLTLRGNAPHGAFKWFKDVEVGQMVLETSTMFQRSRDRYGVGRLVKKTREPFPGDFGTEEPPLEDCWYIECLDGGIYRWTNADFVRVPTTVTPWEDRAALAKIKEAS